MSFTNSQLAQKISDMIDHWSGFAQEYADWLGGTVGGGPGADGQYPLTDWLGVEYLVKAPAQLQEDVDGLVSSASSHASDAAASAAAALASENEAATQAGLATTARTAAESAQTAAETAESAALNSSVNATASQNAAATSESNAATSETNAATSETNAAASETKASEWAEQAEDVEVEIGQYSALHHAAKAAASAAAAQTWDPQNYAALAGATFTGSIAAPFMTVGTGSEDNGTVIMDLNASRAWRFTTLGTGSSTALVLESTTNKRLFIGGVTNGIVAEFNTGSISSIFTNQVDINSAGDAILTLNADSGNASEVANPFIKMTQDGGIVGTVFGMTGAVDVDAEGNIFTNGGNNATALHNVNGNGLYLGVANVASVLVTATGLQIANELDIELTKGNNAPTAMAVRAVNNPANSDAIFAIESSGSATRMFVTQGNGVVARDGYYIGTADNGVWQSSLVEVMHHVSSGYTGGKITVSASAPSSPTQGDIWFDIS